MKRVSLTLGIVGLSAITGFVLYGLGMYNILISLGIVAFFVIAGLITNWWGRINGRRGAPLFWPLGAIIWGLLALFIIVMGMLGLIGWNLWWGWLIVGIVSFIGYLIFITHID